MWFALVSTARRLLKNPRRSRYCKFSEDRQEPSAGRSRSATDKLGDTARAENWRNPEGASVACAGFSTVSLASLELSFPNCRATTSSLFSGHGKSGTAATPRQQ